MSLQGLQERLAALQETTTQLRELIDRLSSLKFQPGSVPLDTEEEDSPSGELSAEIGLILRTGLEEQELLQEEVKYARPEGHDKARLKEGVERLGTQLASQRAAFRKARLAAKKSLEKAQRLERELVIQSFSRPASECASPSSGNGEVPVPVLRRPRGQTHQQYQQSSLSQEDRQTVGASSNVTSALRRTHDLIAAELSRSEYAHQTLTESSAALRQLNESYTSLDSMLASSRDLLGTLLRSQKSDTWYLQTALYMLMVTGAWLVFRRLLYGPAWWLVWLPLRVLFGVGSTAGSIVLRGKGSGSSQSATVEVGSEGGRIRVDGLPDDDLPIVKVGHDSDADSDNIQLDKVIEKAREAAADAVNMPGADEDDNASKEANSDESAEKGADSPDEPKNTKKRMWEEPEGVPGQGYVRDEL